ncbi:uncharacterized protein LTR77_002797 [Saxophila tyrrhenica]|uniref:N-acetyltransferase domain-containing protein n=1 Tax=Saxophila tyrrhenica TaxID=1690608 RepID=A0AAV9PG39_9PEZI|nr:hypothetical protein LTR77_002797 [Saxophila tyrrhenica]
MPITIEPCKYDDAETMIITGEAAFAEDALNNAIFDPKQGTPEEAFEYRNWRITITKQRLSGEGKYYFKAMDDSNGRLVGYIGLVDPKVDIHAQSKAPHPDFVNMEFFERVHERIEEAKRKWVGGREDVWYVASMCVHPDYQGQGIAKRLMQRGLEEVDKVREEVMLEGTAAALKLYRSCGFELLEEIVLLDGRCTLAVMMRRAKA